MFVIDLEVSSKSSEDTRVVGVFSDEDMFSADMLIIKKCAFLFF